MNTTAMSAQPRTRPNVPGAPLLPQVNLLPPDVRANRQLGKIKAWLGVALLGTILVSGLLFVWAAFSHAQAEKELVRVQDQNAQLVSQQAQYAEVPQVLKQLDEAQQARALGMSTEVLWKDYLGAIGATAPEGMSIQTFAVSGATPMEAPMPVDDPLRGPSVATLTFQARFSTMPDISSWMDALETVPGFSDPWLTAAQLTAEDGPPYYEISGTVELTADAYPLRFASTEKKVG